MDKILYVGIPPPQDRVAILNTITKVCDYYLVQMDTSLSGSNLRLGLNIETILL